MLRSPNAIWKVGILSALVALSGRPASAQEESTPIVVHWAQVGRMRDFVSSIARERPDITLVSRGEGARNGRLWIRNLNDSLLIVGEVSGGQPEFARAKDQILSKDHVEVWLAATPDLDLPEVGWGSQFGFTTLPKGEASCSDSAKELPDGAPAEKNCRAWAAKQLHYRPYFKRLFIRQWIMTPDLIAESYATPAYEEIQKRFAGKDDDWLEIVKPQGQPQMFLYPQPSGYSFGIVIPLQAFPPLPTLTLRDLYVLVDVFKASRPGEKTGAYSTSSAERVYGKPTTFNALRLDPPYPFQLTPCELPLTGTDKREEFHPAWFFPHRRGPGRYEADTFIVLNDPVGYRYEPDGLSPTIRGTHYFWRSVGEGEWVCGPQLTYKKGNIAKTFPYLVSENGFEAKRLGDGDLLIKTGPRVWYSEFGSGQCGACPRTDLRIFDLTKSLNLYGALALGGVIDSPRLVSQDFTVSNDWLRVVQYDQVSEENAEPGPWSSTAWCLKRDTQRYHAEVYIYEACGQKEDVQPPNPPVLKELREKQD